MASLLLGLNYGIQTAPGAHPASLSIRVLCSFLKSVSAGALSWTLKLCYCRGYTSARPYFFMVRTATILKA